MMMPRELPTNSSHSPFPVTRSERLGLTRLAAIIVFVAVSSIPGWARSQDSTSVGINNELLLELKSPKAKDRAKAAKEIGKRGNVSDIPALVAALHDSSASVRRQVVLALASFTTPASLNGLIEATRDSDPAVRTLAVEAVTGYYTGHPPSTGFVGFVEKEYKSAKRGFAPDDTEVDPGTVVDPRAVSALDRAMMDTRMERAARAAARGLGILDAKAAVPDLIVTAHSPDENLAREALNSLVKIKDTSAGPRLMDLLKSSDAAIQQDAAVTVGILRTRPAVPQLQWLAQNSPNSTTRRKALEGLAYIGDPISRPIFQKDLSSRNKAVRTYAAEGLGRSGDTPALPDLLNAAVVEKDANVKLAMEFALTALGNDEYLSQMVSALGSRLHGDTAQAYLTELAQNPSFLPMLYPFLSSPNAAIRSRLCLVLMYSGDASSVPGLEKASHDSNATVAADALRALSAIRARGQ